MREKNNPLVSIIVITYNSSKYVLETLESAKAQTYQNIELIISDDASQDDTVQICKAWLEENGERFVRTDLVTVGKNTGTSANCNRGLKLADGEWMKFIAGDDVFQIDYFENMKNLLIKSDVNIIAGSILSFENSISHAKLLWPNFNFPSDLITQKRIQLVYGLLLSPSILMRRKKLISLGGFDERFPIMEDDPLWFQFYEDGNICQLSYDSIVYYRQHVDSVNSMKTREIFYRKPYFLKDSTNFGYKVKLPALKKDGLYLHYFLFFTINFIEKIIYNRGCRLDNKLNYLLKKIISKLNYLYWKIPVKNTWAKKTDTSPKLFI